MDEELNDSDISLDDSVHSGENDELVNLLDVPYTTTESREEDSLEYEVNVKNLIASTKRLVLYLFKHKMVVQIEIR